ncbi:rRNA cytosine-C5-methylase [Magnetovibrio sp. PR-2]|uniref:RsmB/NOP family class I SAM-dependent RNA methyltransferase n=1 Tax=Magnetovibrio sp. PR-2 TaxID=3120356 RepID=UPI002FCE29D7
MLPAARTEAAIYLLGKIADERRPADDIVRAWFQARRFVGAKDRRAIRERVYSVLRSLNRLDWHLGEAETSARNRVLAAIVLEGGDAEANFDGSKHGPTALTDIERALAERLAGKSLDDPAQPDHVQAELAEWLSDKLKPVLGDAFEDEMAALNEPAPMDLRVALGRVSRDQALKALAKGGIQTELTPFSPMGLRLHAHTDVGRTQAFRKGFVEVQDEGSQLLALLVGAKSNMRVLDYCAGAGGKTLAIADRMGLTDGMSTGELVATDIEAARLDRMTQRLKRAKLMDKVKRITLDGTEQLGDFDRVLIDAPCSGSGTWRRHPEQKRRLTKGRLEELLITQINILTNAAPMVKPGGRLIYATCSLLADENEQPVEAFLNNHPNFQRIPIQQAWAETIKKVPCPEMKTDDLRLTPAEHGTDGFFVCVMCKSNEGFK